jgi:hypothetical protein
METRQIEIAAEVLNQNITFPSGRRRWEQTKDALTAGFDKPDIEAAQVLFASVAAHRIMDHPPAWNMLIAPSGSMKTALLNTLSGLPSIQTLDEVTENTFISGMLDKSKTGKKTKTDQMPASLLNRIGDEGILIVPDFSTILAMNRNKQPVILSQLRRIYDGSFAREFGTAENLADRKWQGRITFLAGVTPEFDKYHSVFQSLGERFIRTRWPRAGGVDAALRAMRQRTEEAEQTKAAVHNLLTPVMEAKSIPAPRMKEQDEIRLAHLGELIVLGRAFVSRERYTHDIEDAPDPEGNTRFPQQLAQIGRGWAALMGDDAVSDEGLKLIARVGFDCIPPRRGEVLKALIRGKNPYSLGLPNPVVERSIEELKHVGLVDKPDRGAKLSEQALRLLDGARMPEPWSISPQFLHENGREYVN